MSVRQIESKIVFKNFSGAPVRYFPEGSRYFGLLVPDDLQAEMADEGWNIKYNTSTREYWMLVKVSKEYDQDLSGLDKIPSLSADVIIEGVVVPEAIGDYMVALLISITPKQ